MFSADVICEMRVNRIVAVLACLCPLASAQTDDGLWRFVHPNAKALIGMDVQRIRSSRVVEEMSTQLQGLPMPAGVTLQFPGMDLLHQIDRVIISSPGRTLNSAEEEPPLMIAVSGKFEPVKLNQMFVKAGARRQVYDAVTIYRLQDEKNSDFGFVVLNSQTLLIGDAKSLFTVIDRVTKGTAALPPIVGRARDMDVAYDFWAVLATAPSALASERLPFGEFSAKLTGLQAGIAVRDGLTVDVDISAMTEKAARELADQFSKLIHLASKDRESHPEWAGLDRKLKIRVERGDVHLALRLDAQELHRVAKALDESRARRQALSAAVNLKPQPQQEQQARPPAAPEPRLVIRIEGLDGGPREIPYRPANK